MIKTEERPLLQDRASLHEKAVQTVARGDHVAPKERRARGKDRVGGRSRRVTHGGLPHLHPLVRDALPDGTDVRNVQILDTRHVIIWNHPAPWPGVTE